MRWNNLRKFQRFGSSFCATRQESGICVCIGWGGVGWFIFSSGMETTFVVCCNATAFHGVVCLVLCCLVCAWHVDKGARWRKLDFIRGGTLIFCHEGRGVGDQEFGVCV